MRNSVWLSLVGENFATLLNLEGSMKASTQTRARKTIQRSALAGKKGFAKLDHWRTYFALWSEYPEKLPSSSSVDDLRNSILAHIATTTQNLLVLTLSITTATPPFVRWSKRSWMAPIPFRTRRRTCTWLTVVLTPDLCRRILQVYLDLTSPLLSRCLQKQT